MHGKAGKHLTVANSPLVLCQGKHRLRIARQPKGSPFVDRATDPLWWLTGPNAGDVQKDEGKVPH